MTPDELHAELASKASFLTPEEWAAFLAATPEDQEAIASAFSLAAVPPSADLLRTALDILQCAAGLVPLPGIGTGIVVLRKLIGE